MGVAQSGVRCVQLVGSMSLAERERAISAFSEDAGCRIFLMSLKAGGVALNLTVASHVSQWMPSAPPPPSSPTMGMTGPPPGRCS